VERYIWGNSERAEMKGTHKNFKQVKGRGKVQFRKMEANKLMVSKDQEEGRRAQLIRGERTFFVISAFYHVGYTRSCQITKVEPHWAQSVLGWVTKQT
jgi:hypothetical protein